MKLKNSFLEQDFSNNKVLVLVPHQDDEINVGNGLLYTFSKNGADVYVVYTTNGDYEYNASVRIGEAIKALSKLGIDKKHIILMGYADTPKKYGKKHIFNVKSGKSTSPAGFSETYGSEGIDDFSYKLYGIHKEYNYSSYKIDLKDVILSILPNVVFCIEHDTHPDHRMLSIVFDEVMGEILKKYKGKYTPLVLKTFAYATAFYSAEDFYQRNILSVQKPKVGITDFYPADLMELSYYIWNNRVRFPMECECRQRFLHNNKIFQALFQHGSQEAGKHALRLVNSDAIFWQRRTDNLAYMAEIEVSSGDYNPLYDFKIVDKFDVCNDDNIFDDNIWIPNEADNDRYIKYTWDQEVSIDHVVLYGNVNNGGYVKNIDIYTDSGVSVTLEKLPHNGRPAVVAIKAANVKSLIIKINTVVGDAGIAECEIFPTKYQKTVLNPFIKIMINNNFCYDYWISDTEEEISLDIFRYMESREIRYEILNTVHSHLEGSKLHISSKDKQIIIRASVKDDINVYDEISISRHSELFYKTVMFLQRLEWSILKFFIRKKGHFEHFYNKHIRGNG